MRDENEGSVQKIKNAHCNEGCRGVRASAGQTGSTKNLYWFPHYWCHPNRVFRNFAKFLLEMFYVASLCKLSCRRFDGHSLIIIEATREGHPRSHLTDRSYLRDLSRVRARVPFPASSRYPTFLFHPYSRYRPCIL
jgi:hypothetical protein